MKLILITGGVGFVGSYLCQPRQQQPGIQLAKSKPQGRKPQAQLREGLTHTTAYLKGDLNKERHAIN